jgi:hypothetical protein
MVFPTTLLRRFSTTTHTNLVFSPSLGGNQTKSLLSRSVSASSAPSSSSSLYNSDKIEPWTPSSALHYTASGQFSIVSFNMLAPVYKRLSSMDLVSGYHKRESQYEEIWKARANKLKKFFENEIFTIPADIIALQEFWLEERYLNIFREQFYAAGYQLYMLQRTGSKADAVIFVIKTSSFEVKMIENIYLCNMRDRVAIMLWLIHKETGKQLLIANTHLSFPHNHVEQAEQLQQVEMITKFMEHFSNKYSIHNSSTRIIVGDLNADLKSTICNHLRKVGYFSCYDISSLGNLMSPAPVTTTTASTTTTAPSVSTSPLIHSSPLPLGGGNHSVSALENNNGSVSLSANATRQFSSASSTAASIPIPTPMASMVGDSCEVIDFHFHPQRKAKFVSHRTHLKDDVGVDHIFIRPEGNKEEKLSSQQLSHNPSPVDWTKPQSLPDEEEEAEEERKEKQKCVIPKEKTFVTDCYVLPKNRLCYTWDEEFRISDHRPVMSTVIFGKRKAEEEH